MRLYAAADTLFFTKREEWSFAFPSEEAGTADVGMYVNGRAQQGERVAANAPTPRAVAGNLGLPMDPEDVARYAGVYDVSVSGHTLELTVYGADASGRLMSTFAGTPTRLIPIDEDVFAVVINPSINVAFTVRDGRAESVSLRQGSRSDSGLRRH